MASSQSAIATTDVDLSLANVELMTDLLFWVERLESLEGKFSHIFAHRTRYLWKWVQVAFQTTGFCDTEEHLSTALSLKCRCGFIMILLDDLCDVYQDERALQQALGIVTIGGSVPTKKDDPLYHLLYEVWLSVEQELASAPNYLQLAEELAIAIDNLRNSFAYCLSASQQLLAGEKIWNAYLRIVPHSTSIYLAGFIDLLHMASLDRFELERLRQLFENTQKMAQIGNWLTTYDRELQQNDLSSGLVVLAIENGWLDKADLQQPIDSSAIGEKLTHSPAKTCLLGLWHSIEEESLALAKQADPRIESSLMRRYVNSFSTILRMQQASVGRT